MGLLVHSSVIINEKTNLTLKDVYVNIKDVMISRTTLNYKVFYQYQYFCNKQCRDDQKDPLLSQFNTIDMDTMTPNLYDTIYNDLKAKYESYSDD